MTASLRPLSVAISDAALAGSGLGVGDELSAKLGWRDAGGAWELSAGPLVGLQRRSNAYNDVGERFTGGEISIDRLVPVSSRLVLRIGADGRGQRIWQHVTRTDSARLAAIGIDGSARYSGAAWGGGAHAGLRLWLTPGLFADAGARLLALGAKTDSGTERRLLGGAQLGLGTAW